MPPTAKKKKKKDNGAIQKGQQKLFGFFKQKKTVGKENQNNNNKANATADIGMGLDSNLRKSTIKKAKEFGTSPPKKKNAQLTIDGRKAEGRCDEGTKVCACCEKLKSNRTLLMVLC